MTMEAKRELAKTIRELRTRVLDELGGVVARDVPLGFCYHDEVSPGEMTTHRWLERWWQKQEVAGRQPETEPQPRELILRAAAEQLAYTALNRVVILRLMEAPGSGGAGRPPLLSPPLVTGGWKVAGMTTYWQRLPATVRENASEGYACLLRLVFEDLASDLPGVFGRTELEELIPIPATAWRLMIDTLSAPELESCWTDDMTLGWVYQYWNDPEREALDQKLNRRQKLQSSEIASKTQLFTERYVVDWLLQNSLGPMWLAICAKQGWIPEVVESGVFDSLEARRDSWRHHRETGQVQLDEIMPLYSDVERRWAYYMPQDIGDNPNKYRVPPEVVAQAPDSVRDLRLIDPAVGAGHFLVVAMELLFHLYREEARHRGTVYEQAWEPKAIVECILENNLHGVDLDHRAVQIAAATMWLKGQRLGVGARPSRLNLVASTFRLDQLSGEDEALGALRLLVEKDTGVTGELTDMIVGVLRNADHLGSLLRFDHAVEVALEAHEKKMDAACGLSRASNYSQNLSKLGDRLRTRQCLVEHIEKFLAQHTQVDDLGVSLGSQQLAAGVRFIRILREGVYDLVMANPPYQSTSKMAEFSYVAHHYSLGKADLFAAFMLRGLDLTRTGGISAMLTMRNWMFLKRYAKLRRHLLDTYTLSSLGDFDRGAFDGVYDEVVSVSASVFTCSKACGMSLALCPTPREDTSRDRKRTVRKHSATLCHVGRYSFEADSLKSIPEWPLVYWWDEETKKRFGCSSFGSRFPVLFGVNTGNNSRFVRYVWEVDSEKLQLVRPGRTPPDGWVPYVMGGKGEAWFESLKTVICWRYFAFELKLSVAFRFGDGAISWKIPNTDYYFGQAVAFSLLGSRFGARVHRYASVIDSKGSSVYTDNVADVMLALNTYTSKMIMSSLNPTLSYQVSDVKRLPFSAPPQAAEIFYRLRKAFDEHESSREGSVEYKKPGPSCWEYTQSWAQTSIDRAPDAPLPTYTPVYQPESAAAQLSFALGVALGRFSPNGDGILDPVRADFCHALPAGLLFLDRTIDDRSCDLMTNQQTTLISGDGLSHPASKVIHDTWAAYRLELGTKRSLRDWLALDFFRDFHCRVYENRPIYWPLSSENRKFVAWVNIHRWDQNTLHTLLRDHLRPALTCLEGVINDLNQVRHRGHKQLAHRAKRRLDIFRKARDELERFALDVKQVGVQGPMATDSSCPQREQDHPYHLDLDDGVAVSSTALWRLLEPQWKEPKKWWRELALAESKQDYDWSQLAMRYFPKRADAKCRLDPSLAAAHGCLWRYHPVLAWAWELRLQDEIGCDFRLEEGPYRPGGQSPPIGESLPELPDGDEGSQAHRQRYLVNNRRAALTTIEQEAKRRIGPKRSTKRKRVAEMRIQEEGFWRGLPDEVYAMELRVSRYQRAEFRLISPDESTARATHEARYPDEAERRRRLLSELTTSS